MKQRLNKNWWKAAGIRAVRTWAQTALSMITVGAALNEVDFVRVLSISTVAAIYSMLTSLAGLPEVVEDGDQD